MDISASRDLIPGSHSHSELQIFEDKYFVVKK